MWVASYQQNKPLRNDCEASHRIGGLQLNVSVGKEKSIGVLWRPFALRLVAVTDHVLTDSDDSGLYLPTCLL